MKDGTTLLPVRTPNHLGSTSPNAVTVILAVSTRAVNPLQALQELNTRPVELPNWVDPTALRYYLIIHPANSELTDPMCVRLSERVGSTEPSPM